MSHPRATLLALVVGVVWFSAAATAQPVGAFRWQLQPYCNVMTLSVTHQNGVYTLDGTDDRCSAAQAASAVGIAFLNPNGMIGFGITTVLPGGTPVHLEAAISIPSLSGTWRDSSGNSGTFVFTPGGSTGGAPRPVSSGGVPPGSITAVQLASGAVGPSAIAANAITGGHIVDGSLTGADLANDAVGPSAIAANAVTGGKVLDGSLTHADIGDRPRVWSVETPSNIALPLEAHTVVKEVTVVAPAAGRVILNASGSLSFTSNVPQIVYCSLTTGTGLALPYSAIARQFSAVVPFGGTRTFSVAAGSSTTFRLVCFPFGANVIVLDAVLTALFVAGS
jgi:hypothetical protein